MAGSGAPSWQNVLIFALCVLVLVLGVCVYLLHEAYIVQGTWFDVWEHRVMKLEESSAYGKRLESLTETLERISGQLEGQTGADGTEEDGQ